MEEACREEFESAYLKVTGESKHGWEGFKRFSRDDLEEDEFEYVGRYYNSEIERCWQLWLRRDWRRMPRTRPR